MTECQSIFVTKHGVPDVLKLKSDSLKEPIIGEVCVKIKYSGILPDLFSEEAGVVVQGYLEKEGTFRAVEVLCIWLPFDEDLWKLEGWNILEIQFVGSNSFMLERTISFTYWNH